MQRAIHSMETPVTSYEIPALPSMPSGNPGECAKSLTKTQVNLKRLPCTSGAPLAVANLVLTHGWVVHERLKEACTDKQWTAG